MEQIITSDQILEAPHNGVYDLNSDFIFRLYYVNVAMQQLHVRGVADWNMTEAGHENLDFYFIGAENYFGDTTLAGVKRIRVLQADDDNVVIGFDEKLEVKAGGFYLYRSWQGMFDFYPYFDSYPMPAYRRYRRFKEENPRNIAGIKKWIAEFPHSLDSFFSATCELEEEAAAELAKALPEEYALYLKNKELKERAP